MITPISWITKESRPMTVWTSDELYLAATSGCQVVLTDLPLEGLRVAANRATSKGLAARTGVVAAAASGPPFRAGSFDVVVHTDVLC
jgi:2-polyprenyl-3-methyl-5-hydroxy-6-metoxy-1,4-benzoquinol methylase